MDIVTEFFRNKTLITALVAFFVAQFIKIIVGIIKDKKFPWDRLFGTGGMPSSHSAGVCALTTMVGLTEGFTGTHFAISITFASIVMYDATGIRSAAGRHAEMINLMFENLQDFFHQELKQEKLKTLLGHTQPQVFLGACLGIATGLISYFLI